MPLLDRDRLPALRLAFVAAWVLVPLVALLTFSFALLTGAAAVALGLTAGLVFWRNHWRVEWARSEEESRGRWRAALMTYLLFFLAGLTGRVAVRVGEMARNDLSFRHQGLVSGFMTFVIVVSLLRLAWLFPFRRRELGLSRKVAAVSLLAVVWLWMQEPKLGRLSKQHEPLIYRVSVGVGPWAWRFSYRGAIALDKDGRASSVERFVLEPPEPDARLRPEDFALRTLDAGWRAAKEDAGVTVDSERVARSERDRDGLRVELRGPIEVRVVRLGLLLDAAHVAPSGARTVPVAATPDEESDRGSHGWQISPWDGARTESAHLEVRVPGLPVLCAGPTEQLEMKDRRDPLALDSDDPRRWSRIEEPISFDFRWPPSSWAVIREPLRPRFEVLYIPSPGFAWLRTPLRAAYLHPAAVNRFSLLMWPVGLVLCWVYRREILRDLDRERGRMTSPPPARG